MDALKWSLSDAEVAAEVRRIALGNDTIEVSVPNCDNKVPTPSRAIDRIATYRRTIEEAVLLVQLEAVFEELKRKLGPLRANAALTQLAMRR